MYIISFIRPGYCYEITGTLSMKWARASVREMAALF